MGQGQVLIGLLAQALLHLRTVSKELTEPGGCYCCHHMTDRTCPVSLLRIAAGQATPALASQLKALLASLRSSQCSNHTTTSA